MNFQQVESTPKELMLKNKDILAVDERLATMDKRFDALDTESTRERRWVHRKLRFATQSIGEHLSGAIRFDKTIRQKASDDTPLPQVLKQQGIIPGIKADESTVVLPLPSGEEYTQGLDGSHKRLIESHREWA